MGLTRVVDMAIQVDGRKPIGCRATRGEAGRELLVLRWSSSRGDTSPGSSPGESWPQPRESSVLSQEGTWWKRFYGSHLEWYHLELLVKSGNDLFYSPALEA